MPEHKDTPSQDQRFDDTHLRRETESTKEVLKREYALSSILGKSKAIRDTREKLSRISLCDVNVLITGESGTGKELAARAVHYLSARRGHPFIPVNCGAIPESLFENELFGHVRGAFTDASLPQAGLVKEAEGGTLFLDEIGIITPFIQSKLLRLIENKEYRPVGAPKRYRADIRVIAATNRNLQSLVQHGGFREDLFYRLNVVFLHLPPLADRKEDVPILVEHFIKKFCRQHGKESKGVTPDAMNALISYSWPGNIRELENLIQRIVVLSTSCSIGPEHLHFCYARPAVGEAIPESFKVAKKKALDSFVKTYLVRLLTEYGGSVVKAAEVAGKSRTAMWNLLKKYNISPTQFR